MDDSYAPFTEGETESRSSKVKELYWKWKDDRAPPPDPCKLCPPCTSASPSWRRDAKWETPVVTPRAEWLP